MTQRDVDEAHEIAGLLFGAADVTRQEFHTLCERFDLTPVQARTLMALDSPKPMREIAAVLRCDPSNVTGLADRLEDRGLVTRSADGGDRRIKRLVATSSGSALRRELERALLATSPFMSGLDATERKTLRRLLEKINDRPPDGGSRATPAGATSRRRRH